MSIRLRTIAPHTLACRSRWLREPLRNWSVSKNAGSTTSASELNNLSRTKLSFGWLMTAKQAFTAAFAIRSISDSFILIPSWARADCRRQHRRVGRVMRAPPGLAARCTAETAPEQRLRRIASHHMALRTSNSRWFPVIADVPFGTPESNQTRLRDSGLSGSSDPMGLGYECNGHRSVLKYTPCMQGGRTDDKAQTCWRKAHTLSPLAV